MEPIATVRRRPGHLVAVEVVQLGPGTAVALGADHELATARATLTPGSQHARHEIMP